MQSATACASCGRSNRPGNRFCSGCGSPLASRCSDCGAEIEPGGRFCGACGASLAAPAAEAAAARKVVSIVFADLIGSTALHERLDAESVRRFMDRYYDAMRAAVEAERGSVTQLLGDGVKAVFGVPRVAEDDAIHAVRAAVAMQQAFRELAQGEIGLVGRTGLRVAVNTGEVVASHEKEIIGDPVNVAARLQEEAREGDVVIGEATRRLVGELVTLAPLGAFAVKGRSERVSAWRVASLERPVGASTTPFVGREHELRRLLAIHAAAVESRRARLAVVLGSPGLGKSRLIGEVARRLADQATVLFARCDVAGGATFAPLAGALRAFLRIDDAVGGDALGAWIEKMTTGDAAERSRVAAGIAALLAGTPAEPEETFFVVRRFLAGLAATGPVVLVVDDLQWAEPLLLDLVEHLVQWSSDVPLLVLVGARPELRDARSSLTAPGALVAEVVTLAGLDAAAATRLAANAIGADELPAAIAGRVLTASEGNPLFVGELVRMLVQDGALVREGEGWKIGTELAALEMPPTIQALLAARIERLRPEERTVLERAAVVGRQFSRAAVRELLSREITQLDRHLESLRRSELIEPDTGWFLGEPALRFHHVLVRDAAYRRVLKEKRAELHERLADWVSSRVGDAAPHDETLGWHLEQAHQHLRELGPLDAHGRALGLRAARYLGEAGRRALARDDVPLAASLLGRALERLDPGDPARADLALDWCEALLSAGEVGAAARAIDELGRFADASPRLRAWHTCFAGQRAALTDPESLHATAEAVAAAAEALAAAGDISGEAKGHLVHALALSRLGRVGACEAALDRALAAARRADRRRANSVLAGAPLAALWGPSPVTRASGRCLDVVRVLRITQGAPAVEAVALRCQGVLEALRGRSEAARRMVAASRRMVEELGITQRLLEADLFAGLIELIEGDAVAAERCLRAAYEGLRAHGLGIDAAQAAALLARALLAQDRAAEAEALSHESEKLAGHDLQAAIAWRGVRAEALARRGQHAAAIEFARAAVDLAAATDALLFHADARLALAAALRAAGRADEAAAEEVRATSLWEAKGATLLARRARREVGRVAEPPQRAPAQIEPARIARRVPPNHATVHLARIDEAVAAGDLQTVRSLLRETEALDHVTGRDYGIDSLFANFRWMVERSADLAFVNEPIAALGPSLALARWREAGSQVVGDDIPIGPFELDGTVLVEADSDSRSTRVEVFAPHRLGDAIVRLYERYAELLPDGPERERAAAIARSAAAVLGPYDLARYAAAFAPDIEYIDHRMQGVGPATGRPAVLEWLGSLLEVAEDVANRFDDVLALRSDALLLRWTNSGTERAGGGPFERRILWLGHFGADGSFTRIEVFEGDRDAEALARFDELVAAAAPPARAARRRVRPNALTARAAGLEQAVAARDEEALSAEIAHEFAETVDHTTGVSYGRDGLLLSWRSLLRSEAGTCRYEPLATLGDSLALLRFSRSASETRWRPAGLSEESIEVGAFYTEELHLSEGDAEGRIRRSEIFPASRLGDAVVRLYERYAELLPEGPERERAAATARSVAILLGPLDCDRWATAISPGVEFIDHRILGLGPTRGAEAFLRGLRSLLEATDDTTNSSDDLLDLRSDALLVCRTNSGTASATGGAYERPLIQLWIFGADGLLARSEHFDPDREAEALARFDALTAAASPLARPVRRHVRPNPAIAHAARFDAAVAARDAAALPALFSGDARGIDHTTHTAWDRQAASAWRSLLLAENPTCRHEPLATLGDALALFRMSLSASGLARGSFDIGAYEKTDIHLIEVDARGLRCWAEVFATDHLGDAIVRLYERYAELLPAGPERARAAAIARSVAAWVGALDLERLEATMDPSVECVDHRILGSWSARGSTDWLRHWRAQLDLSTMATREHEVLALEPAALLVRRTWFGTDRVGGGVYENLNLVLLAFGADGRLTRAEAFDPDREAEALARFDELTTVPASPRIETAATRSIERFEQAWNARDWQRIEALFAAGFRYFDRRPMLQLELDRDRYLGEFLRTTFEMASSRVHMQVLATRGGRLVLSRFRLEVSDRDVGASEIESLFLLEVDAQGERLASVRFDADDIDAAYAELDARYAAGEAAPYARTLATLVRLGRAIAARDWEQVTSVLAPDLVVEDHRPLALHGSLSRDELLASFRALVGLRPDAVLRSEHALELSDRAFLVVARWMGAEAEGTFEIPSLVAAECGAEEIWRMHQYDLEQLDEARARFEALRPDPLRIPPNAATRTRDRAFEAIAAGDWDALRALARDDCRFEDRGRRAQLVGGIDAWIETFRFFRSEGGQPIRETLGTTGDRIQIERVVWTRGPAGGEIEIEQILVTEVDAEGCFGAMVRFDPDDRRAAFDEAHARFLAGEAASSAAQAAVARFHRAFDRRDLMALRACLADGFVGHDRRALGVLGTLDGDQWVESIRNLFVLAPDTTVERLQILTWGGQGRVERVRQSGTREGGPFENPMILAFLTDRDRVEHCEAFDVADTERALARFEELCAAAAQDRGE